MDGVTRDAEVCAGRRCDAVRLFAVLPAARQKQEHLAQGMKTRSKSNESQRDDLSVNRCIAGGMTGSKVGFDRDSPRDWRHGNRFELLSCWMP